MVDLHVNDEADRNSSDNDDEQYSKLAASVLQLDSSQRVKAATRTEVSSEISEFHLPKVPQNDSVLIKDLANVLGQKAGHSEISEKIQKLTQKSTTLPKPLKKPVADQIKRSIGFSAVKDRLEIWDPVVTRNRLSDRLSFPLHHARLSLQNSSQFISKFKTQTPLEAEIAKVLQLDDKPETAEEDEFPLTFEEMVEKRKEMARLRAKQSYQESKAYRQSKIKSKKYHRILRREKIRQQLKDFEILQKTDPEAALKKLQELDKTRAQERASLKHRSTGKWAKNLQIRAKYDKESRKALAQQLTISKEMTQKVMESDSSDDHSGDEGEIVHTTKNTGLKDNPWALGVSSEVSEFVSGFKKYWETKNEKVLQADETGAEDKSTSETGNKSESKEQQSPRPIEQSVANQKEAIDEPKQIKKKKEELGDSDESRGQLSKKDLKRPSNTNSKIGRAKRRNLAKSKKGEIADESKDNSTGFVDMNRISGVWTVTPTKTLEKKSDVNIDDLFSEAEEKLSKKLKKKLQKVKKKLNKSTKTQAKKQLKKVTDDKVKVDKGVKHLRGAIERPDIDQELSESAGRKSATNASKPLINAVAMADKIPETTPVLSTEIDPTKYIKVKPKHLATQIPDNITAGEDGMDDEEKQRMTIMEAFGDDDVIAEFKEMKEAETRVAENLDVAPTLPGWGSWAGEGIVPSKRKKNPRRLIDIAKLPKRKDKDRLDTIINENENPNIKEHAVKEIPYPFKSVSAFEANIRTPVGRDWVPETAHRKFIQKPLVTKMGTVIEPMSQDELLRMDRKKKSLYKGKVKNTKQ